MIEEFAHGVFHVESKGWRTLPMLVANPGRLTREYIHGRRARYIAPLAMFLFMVFLTFASFGLAGDTLVNMGGASSPAETRADLAEARKNLAEVAADPDTPAAALRASAMGVELARKAVARADALHAGAQPAAIGNGDPAASGPEWARVIKRRVEQGRMDIVGPTPALTAKIRRALLDPEFTAYKVEHLASKLSFFLVPMTLPVLWLLFARRRGVNLYDHTVFALYSLSFMSLLAILLMLFSAGPAWAKPAAALVVLIPPVHMFAQLKGAYRLTTGGALWRTAILSLASLTILGLFLALMLLVGLID